MGDYAAPIYEPVHAVESFLDVPRFGHTENITAIVGDERTDYIKGILFIPCFIMAWTVLWLTLLIVFKCCLPKMFLGGKKYEKGEGRNVRLAFLSLSIAFLVTAILFISRGYSSFHNTVDDLQDTKNEAFGLVNEGLYSIENLTSSMQKINDVRDELGNALATLNCPNFPVELTLNITGILNEYNYDEQIKLVQDYTDDIIANSIEYEEDFEDYISQLDRVLRYLVLIFIVPVMVVVVLFIIQVTLGMANKLNTKVAGLFSTINSFVCVPLFIFWMVLAALIAGVSGVVLLILSDVCVGGDTDNPEGTIQDLLNKYRVNEVIHDYVEYYIISGCRGTNPLPDFPGLISDIDDYLPTLNGFIEEARSILENFCPNDSLDSFLSVVVTEIPILRVGLADAASLLTCKTVNELYITVAHEDGCDAVPSSLLWLYGTALTLWVLGVVMVFFRSALYF